MNIRKDDLSIFSYKKPLFFLFVLLFTSCNSIEYFYSVSKMELSVLFNAKKIDKIIKSSDYPVELKEKLLFVKDVKKYAVDNLGLKINKQYLYYSSVKLKQPMFVLTAVYSTNWKFKKWWFPIVGYVPYLGFPLKERAEEEAKKFSKMGYDVDIRPAIAFSTLGYLPDPILPQMLKRADPFIASLIFHELTHGTVYFKSNTMFNEHIAVLVENIGGMQFAEKRWGIDSDEYAKVKNRFLDLVVYSDFISKLYRELNVLYNSKVTDSVKLKKRKLLLKEKQAEFKKIKFNSQIFSKYSLLPPNNAKLWQFMIYYLKFKDMVDIYYKNENCSVNLFLKFFKEKPKKISPWEWLKKWEKYPG